MNEVRASGKYKLYDGNYEDILTYKAEYNCESMLESNRIFDASNSMDEFSFFEVMNHWRTDKLDMSGSNNQFNGTGWGFMVPQKKLYDAFVQEEGVDGYRLNQTMKTYDQISQLGVKVAKGQSLINLKSATTRLYDTEAKIICIVSKKGAQCIECHHKDI